MNKLLTKIWLFLLIFSFISCNEQGSEDSGSSDDSPPVSGTPSPNPNPNPPKPPQKEPPKISYRHDPYREALIQEIENVDFVINDVIQGETLNQLQSFFDSFSDEEQETNENEDDDDFPESDELDELFILFLSNEEEVESDDEYQHFKYTPHETICQDVLAKNSPSVCQEAMTKIDFHLTIIDEDTSNISFYYGNLPIFTLSLNKGIRAYDISFGSIAYMLSDINNMNSTLAPEDYTLYPPILFGQMKLIRFEEEGKINYSIDLLDDVYLSKHIRNGFYEFTFMEAKEEIISFVLDKDSSYLEALLNFGFLYDNKVIERDSIQHSKSTYWQDWGGKITIDNINTMVEFENFGPHIDNTIYELEDNYTESIIAFTPITGKIDVGEDILVELILEGNFSLDLLDVPQNDIAGIFNLNYSGPMNLEITRENNEAGDTFPQFKITQGSMSMEGFDDFAGYLDAKENTCFGPRETEETHFPFAPIDCN